MVFQVSLNPYISATIHPKDRTEKEWLTARGGCFTEICVFSLRLCLSVVRFIGGGGHGLNSAGSPLIAGLG